jgi:hypothetical protein
MALRDPVAVYNAANNVEAHFVRDALLGQGIEAHVIEDVSQVGVWLLGLVPEIHKPQVWVEREDVERAKPILDDYERRTAELRAAEVPGEPTEERPIEVVCDECGQVASFPAVQRGSVQQCPNCRAFVDVGAADFTDEWRESPPDEEASEGG